MYGPGTDLERTPDDASGRTVTAMSASRCEHVQHAGHEQDHPELGHHWIRREFARKPLESEVGAVRFEVLPQFDPVTLRF
jgi:hypothetical protein